TAGSRGRQRVYYWPRAAHPVRAAGAGYSDQFGWLSSRGVPSTGRHFCLRSDVRGLFLLHHGHPGESVSEARRHARLAKRILASRARVMGGLLSFLSSSVRHLPISAPRVQSAVRKCVRHCLDVCFELLQSQGCPRCREYIRGPYDRTRNKRYEYGRELLNKNTYDACRIWRRSRRSREPPKPREEGRGYCFRSILYVEIFRRPHRTPFEATVMPTVDNGCYCRSIQQ
ncbi:unnamed protein product, partial [Laminaria digitata]